MSLGVGKSERSEVKSKKGTFIVIDKKNKYRKKKESKFKIQNTRNGIIVSKEDIKNRVYRRTK